MPKKEEFKKCSICNKIIWADMFVLHLQNVHHYSSTAANEKNFYVQKLSNSNPNSKKKDKKKKESRKTKENANQLNKDVLKPRINSKKVITQQHCKTFHFIWEDIVFKTHEIQIINKRAGKRFTPLECKNSIEGLNKIREEFFVRHHGNKLYKLLAYDQKIMLEWSEDVQNILSLIDSAIEFYNFRYEKAKSTRILSERVLRRWTNAQIFKMFHHELQKEPYLNFLYKNHHEEFKLIPILEFIGSTEEESFLFRIRDRKGMVLVVWENLNPARATYFFRIDQESSVLKNILTYIAEHRQNKRSYLREPKNYKLAKTQLGYVGFIEHENFEDYKRAVATLI